MKVKNRLEHGELRIDSRVFTVAGISGQKHKVRSGTVIPIADLAY
jgi:hypothetical protein